MLTAPVRPLDAGCQLAPMSVERNVMGPFATTPEERLTKKVSPLTVAVRISPPGKNALPEGLIGRLLVTSFQVLPALVETKRCVSFAVTNFSPCAAINNGLPFSGSPLPLLIFTQVIPLSVERKMPAEHVT